MPPKDDLFGDAPQPSPKRKTEERATAHGSSYSAADIEVMSRTNPARLLGLIP